MLLLLWVVVVVVIIIVIVVVVVVNFYSLRVLTPQISGTLLSIVTDLKSAVVWTVLTY